MPSNDPEYQKKYIRKHYQENKEYYKEKAKASRDRYKKKYPAILRRYKTMKGCVDCGYTEHAIALDFDHVRGTKTQDISLMVHSLRPWRLIKEEVKKCDVRCSNCHRVITEKRRRKDK